MGTKAHTCSHSGASTCTFLTFADKAGKKIHGGHLENSVNRHQDGADVAKNIRGTKSCLERPEEGHCKYNYGHGADDSPRNLTSIEIFI